MFDACHKVQLNIYYSFFNSIALLYKKHFSKKVYYF